MTSRFLVNGELVASADAQTVEVIAPATEASLGTASSATAPDIASAVTAARRAFDDGPWPGMSPAERGKYLRSIAEALEARADEFARVLAEEAGLPMKSTARGQVPTAAGVARYYADLSDRLEVESDRAGVLRGFLVRREPTGVVGAITAWNAPLSLGLLKEAPALVAGCTVVLKPAAESLLSGALLAEVFADAGLPPGVVNVTPGGSAAGEALVLSDDIDMVTFTGSSAVGKWIAARCGERVRRASLELGGKSAALVLDDVDLEAALPRLAPVTTMINGQACVNQTRVLAPRSRYAEVVEALTGAYRSFRQGDPLDASVDIGPLISQRQRARVEEFIEAGRAEGAKVTTGGGRPADLPKGWYVEPTVFCDVDNDMRIAREEIFGPVVSVIPYEGDQEGLRLANDSVYGLSGTVWGTDLDRASELARRMRAGTVGINAYGFDYAAPFGGYNESGLGREYGPEGLEEFFEVKSMFMPKEAKR